MGSLMDFSPRKLAENRPSLGNNANNAAARVFRYVRRQRSSAWLIGETRQKFGLPADSENGTDWINPPRPARCRWRVSESVGVHSPAPGSKSAHFSGIERCASVWACPVCAPIIRAGRAAEIGTALDRAVELGQGLLFMTLTLRHAETTGLSESLDLLMATWRRLCSWRAYKRLRKRLGLIGTIRSTEITYGGSGWHPHSHFVIVCERPVPGDEIAAASAEIAQMWQKAVEKVNALATPSLMHGVDLRRADDTGIADYLTKIQEHGDALPRRSVALEIARGDLKRGRAGSLLPFELLDDSTGLPGPRSLWLEYVEATKNRRSFAWSPGLRGQLLPDLDDLTDEEILDEVATGSLVYRIPGKDWDSHFRNDPHAMNSALTRIETEWNL